MDSKYSLFVLCLALWAPESSAAFIESFFKGRGSTHSGGEGSGSSFTASQFGTTGGGSFGNAGSNTSHNAFVIGFGRGSAASDLNVNFKDSSFHNANGAGSSTQGIAESDGETNNRGWGFFGSGKALSSSSAVMNSRAQTIWKPDSAYGPSGSVAQGGGTAGATADSRSSSNFFGLFFSSRANTKSSIDTNIKTFGSDNGSGTTGSVFGSSIGSSTFGNSDSNIAVQLGGMSQHSGLFGISTASAGGQGFGRAISESGSNTSGRTSSNIRVTKETFAGNGHSSSSSSIRG